MKKRITMSLLFLPIILSITNKNYSNANVRLDFEKVNLIFQEIKTFDSEFSDSTIYETISLSNDVDENDFHLFKTKNNNGHSGYFVLDNNYSFLVSHVEKKDSFPLNDKYYYHSPLSIDTERKQRKESKRDLFTPRIKKAYYQYILPQVDNDVFYSYSSSFGSTMQVNNVPEYYNSPEEYNVFPGGGCSPTAGTMLLAFYDKHCEHYKDIFSYNMPLKHEQNIDLVKYVINKVGECMNTDSNGGTSLPNISSGINLFLEDKGYYSYQMQLEYTTCSSSSDGGYVYLAASSIISQRNIALLDIMIDYDKSKGHTVVLTGVNNYQYSGKSLRVNYGWKDQSVFNIAPNCVYGMHYLGLFK